MPQPYAGAAPGPFTSGIGHGSGRQSAPRPSIARTPPLPLPPQAYPPACTRPAPGGGVLLQPPQLPPLAQRLAGAEAGLDRAACGALARAAAAFAAAGPCFTSSGVRALSCGVLACVVACV